MTVHIRPITAGVEARTARQVVEVTGRPGQLALLSATQPVAITVVTPDDQHVIPVAEPDGAGWPSSALATSASGDHGFISLDAGLPSARSLRCAISPGGAWSAPEPIGPGTVLAGSEEPIAIMPDGPSNTRLLRDGATIRTVAGHYSAGLAVRRGRAVILWHGPDGAIAATSLVPAAEVFRVTGEPFLAACYDPILRRMYTSHAASDRISAWNFDGLPASSGLTRQAELPTDHRATWLASSPNAERLFSAVAGEPWLHAFHTDAHAWYPAMPLPSGFVQAAVLSDSSGLAVLCEDGLYFVHTEYGFDSRPDAVDSV